MLKNSEWKVDFIIIDNNKEFERSFHIEEMIIKHIVIVSCLLLAIGHGTKIQFKDCNFTDFRFQSKYNLGKQDELNNTFDSLGPKIHIPDIVYPINSYTNYSFT